MAPRSAALLSALVWLPQHDALLLPGGGVRGLHQQQLARAVAPRCCDLISDLVELEESMIDDDDEVVVDEPAPVVEPPAPPAPPAVPDGEWIMSSEGTEHTLKVGVAGKTMTFETGLMAKLASGAVTVSLGETSVFSAACFERKAELTPLDFIPLRVDYMERMSAAGLTKGGYIKRDGRPTAHETLISRIIDRPIRPLIKEGWSLETQLTAYALSYDGVHVPDVLAVSAASAALSLSQVPFDKPVAGVRVGLLPPKEGEAGPGTFVVNPTKEEIAISRLDLMLAGTAATWSKWPSWRGHGWPPRAPRTASEGLGLPSALVRKGPSVSDPTERPCPSRQRPPKLTIPPRWTTMQARPRPC